MSLECLCLCRTAEDLVTGESIPGIQQVECRPDLALLVPTSTAPLPPTTTLTDPTSPPSTAAVEGEKDSDFQLGKSHKTLFIVIIIVVVVVIVIVVVDVVVLVWLKYYVGSCKLRVFDTFECHHKLPKSNTTKQAPSSLSPSSS